MRRLLSYLRSGRGLPAFAAGTLFWMLLVILEGAVVRATGSGAGCGDHWPLCNGQVLPHHPRLATVIEFTHRSMTGLCTGLTLALIAWTFLASAPGALVRKAAIWSGVLLFTEALLGAVLVLGGFVDHNTSNLRVVVQGVHFTNTLLLLAALGLTWWWQRPRPALATSEAFTPTLAFTALLSVILTGATGSVAALADTLFPSPDLRTALHADLAANSPLLVRMRFLHPTASLLSLALILLIGWRANAGARRTLFGLLSLQFILGIADVWTLAPLSLQVLHLLFADLLWIALTLTALAPYLTHRASRRVHSPSNPQAASERPSPAHA